MSNGLVTTILPNTGIMITRLTIPYLPEIRLPVVAPAASGPGPIVIRDASTYETVLTGPIQNIPAADHGLNTITSLLLLDPDGYRIEFLAKINPDKSVDINSNIDLSGFTLILSGV